MSLNPPQRQAVACRRGPLLVNAGPGSGKTRTVMHRTGSLIVEDHADPRAVLLVTFTRKAAKEMRARLRKIVGAESASHIWAGTFHATCARLLRQLDRDEDREGRRKDFVIYDQSDSRALVKDAIKSLNLDTKIWNPKAVQSRISLMKNAAMQPHNLAEAAEDDERQRTGLAIWKHYEQQLLKSNGYDYDDLQLVIMRLLESGVSAGQALQHRFEHVTVDEYQDTNQVQFRIVKALARSRNLCVVGDHRQSIYGFRGADVRNILSFTEHYGDAKVVDLDINYRSTPQIVRVFNAFFDDCNMTTPNPSGAQVRATVSGTGDREAQDIVSRILERLDKGTPPGEIAVLYRLHALSRAVEEQLRDKAIRYQVVGGLTFYERAEVKDVLAYLRLVVNPHSNIDLQRVINMPPRAVSAKTVDKIRDRAALKSCSMWDAIPTVLASYRLSPKAQQGLRDFQAAIRQARGEVSGEEPLVGRSQGDLFGQVSSAKPTPTAVNASLPSVASALLDTSGYRSYWRKQVDKLASKRKPVELERAMQKQANVEEVVASLSAYSDRAETPTLAGYLEEVALMTDQDKLGDSTVSLMTVHASKGLEFDVVFVVGCEEGMLPFSKAVTPAEIEEEKRLMFVACSRARKYLWLTVAATRFLYGQVVEMKPSRFLRQLPEDVDMDPWLLRQLNGHPQNVDAVELVSEEEDDDDDKSR